MSLPIEELSERLKKALLIRDMKPIELSEKTGIPKSAISHYMSGYAKPKDDRIYIIAKALEVSEAWLLGYEAPMNKMDEESYAQALKDDLLSELSDNVKDYALKLGNLTAEQQAGIFNMIDLMIKKQGKD